MLFIHKIFVTSYSLLTYFLVIFSLLNYLIHIMFQLVSSKLVIALIFLGKYKLITMVEDYRKWGQLSTADCSLLYPTALKRIRTQGSFKGRQIAEQTIFSNNYIQSYIQHAFNNTGQRKCVMSVSFISLRYAVQVENQDIL